MRLSWCVSGIWGWEVFTTAHKVILAATIPLQMGSIAFILRGAASQIWISQKWLVPHLEAKNSWDIRRRVQALRVQSCRTEPTPENWRVGPEVQPTQRICHLYLIWPKDITPVPRQTKCNWYSFDWSSIFFWRTQKIQKVQKNNDFRRAYIGRFW